MLCSRCKTAHLRLVLWAVLYLSFHTVYGLACALSALSTHHLLFSVLTALVLDKQELNLPPVAPFQNSGEQLYEVFIVIGNICPTKQWQECWKLYRLYISGPGDDDDDEGKDSRCARFTAWCVITLAFAALPGSAGVIQWVESGKASLVTATDLAQYLQPLTGFNTVSCLHIQWLLRVDHLKHLTWEKQPTFNNLSFILFHSKTF